MGTSRHESPALDGKPTMIQRAMSPTAVVFGLVLLCTSVTQAQQGRGAAPAPAPEAKAPPATADPKAAPPTPAGITPPPDYVIGPQDILTIVFWRDKDMSADVTVRPDGK